MMVPSPTAPRGRGAARSAPAGDGARVLTAVVVTLGIGGAAGGAVTWLLRFLARATDGRPDAGTAGTFLTVMAFLAALLPGALATALERRRGARTLLMTGGVALAALLAARLDRGRVTAAPAPALGVALVLVAALAAVVIAAVWATAWLTRSAVGPGGSGLAGPDLRGRRGHRPAGGGSR